jgi:hypothetical protein
MRHNVMKPVVVLLAAALAATSTPVNINHSSPIATTAGAVFMH